MLRGDFVCTGQLKQVNHFMPGPPLCKDTLGAHEQISQLLRLPDDVIMFWLFLISFRLNVSHLCNSGYLQCLGLPPLDENNTTNLHSNTLIRILTCSATKYKVACFVFFFLPVQQHAAVLRAQIQPRRD